MRKLEDLVLKSFFKVFAEWFGGIAIIVSFAALGVAIQRKEFWPLWGFCAALLLLAYIASLYHRLAMRGPTGMHSLENRLFVLWLQHNGATIVRGTKLD